MQNSSSGAKPKQKPVSKTKHRDGSQRSKLPPASNEFDGHNQNITGAKKNGKKYSSETRNTINPMQVSAYASLYQTDRNCSNIPQPKPGRYLLNQEKIEKTKFNDHFSRRDNFSKQINNVNLVPIQKNVQKAGHALYHFPLNPQVYYQSYRPSVLNQPISNNLMNTSTPFQDSTIQSGHERLKRLKLFYLEKHIKRIKEKDKCIGYASNNDVKEILKFHLSLLDKKKNDYIEKTEGILRQLQVEPNQLTLLQEEFSKSNGAVVENRWISAYRSNILQALSTSQVLIITGETGYGKSTLVPLYASEICSKMGTVASCQLYHVTVPVLAKRLAELMGTQVGKIVGYSLTRDKVASDNTNVLFTTYHCLLQETLSSPFLSDYSCVVLDDYYDRSIEAEIFLCKAKEIFQLRPNFKLIIISSHHDDRFEKFFTSGESVTVIQLTNIMLPVCVCWNNLRNPNLYVERAIELINSIHRQKKDGNIIVFLCTVQETQKACSMAEKQLRSEVVCFTFHSNTTIDEINEIFSPDPRRKIIFTTKLAESSVNLPDIHFVIDSGKMKEVKYNPRKRQSILSLCSISKENAERRRQLAGHFQNSCCYRLYTEDAYSTEMPEKPLPESSKINPAKLILTLHHYKITSSFDSKFIYPLEKQALDEGLLELKNYGAVKDNSLTKHGKMMAFSPFEVRHAKLVTLGFESDLDFETIVIATLSTLNMPIFSTAGKLKDIGKHKFYDPDGDYFAILDAYLQWKEQNFSEKWCSDNGINHNSLAVLHKKVTETSMILHMKLRPTGIVTNHRKLVELICNCFSDNLCVYSGHFRLGYKLLNTGDVLRIHSSSTFSYKSDNPPQYLVYDHVIVHGAFDFMTNVTPVPDYIVSTIVKNYEMLKNAESTCSCQVDSIVIEPVGEKVIKQEILGKQGNKVKTLENVIKKSTGCDTVIIDPNAESGKIEIFTSAEYLLAAKECLMKHLEKCLEKLKYQEEEACISIENVVMKVFWGQGGMITKISKTESKQSHQKELSDDKNSVYTIVQNFSISLTWKRRLCKGMGFVTFSRAEDFDKACSSLLSGELKICGSKVTVMKSKKAPNQFYLEDLLPLTTNEDLKEAIEKHVSLKVENENACIVCCPPFSTSQEDINIMKETLLLQYMRYLQNGELDVQIEVPNSSATTMKAYLNFDNIADVRLVLNAVKRDGIKKFQEVPLNYLEIYRTTIVCVPEHYNSAKMMIENALGIRKHSISPPQNFWGKFKFSTSLIHGKIQLKLLTNYYNVMQELEKTIADILDGEKVHFSTNQLRNLFSHSGQQCLKHIEKSASCYFVKDFRKKTLSVCGTEKSYSIAECKIKEYLSKMENEIVNVINLGDKHFNRQIIKTLVVKYGIKLKGFIVECKLVSVELNVRYGHLTLYGTPDSIKKAENLLESLNSENKTPLTDENEETCSVCFTAPATGLSYRLEYCGHLYCSDCARLLVAERSLPLKCCKENCQKEFVIEDVLDILEGNEEETQKFLYDSLKMYVERNSKYVKFCPSPDCIMVYDLRSLPETVKSDLWTCPGCRKVTCTRCNTKEHSGMSCDTAKLLREDVDHSLKMWMSYNLESRKRCPTCSSPIEKNGGCNHITCWKCQSHLCWLCLKVFKDSNLVYNHLPYCPENQKPYT